MQQHNLTADRYRRAVTDNVVYAVMANEHVPKTGTADEKTQGFVDWICTTRKNYDVKILMTFTITDNPSCTSGLPSDLPLPGVDQTQVPGPEATTGAGRDTGHTTHAASDATGNYESAVTSENPTQKELLGVAEEAARAAGAVALQGFRTPLEIRSKGGSDIVTQYDNAAEEVAIAAVRAHFPTHSFLAEESGASDAPQDAGSAMDDLAEGDPAHRAFRWIIDPIDGTHNYASQIPFWCVSVAVVDLATNAILVGVVYDPLHQELFAASLGKGATLNGKPISDPTKMRHFQGHRGLRHRPQPRHRKAHGGPGRLGATARR